MTDLAPKLVNFLDDLVWDAHFPICQMGTRMPVPTPTPRRENKHVNLGGAADLHTALVPRLLPPVTHRTSWGAAGTRWTHSSRTALFRSRSLGRPNVSMTSSYPSVSPNLPFPQFTVTCHF